MKGYAKIKENNPFFQRSKSKKEHSFLEQDPSNNLHAKKPQENELKPNIIQDDIEKIKNNEYDDDHHHHKQDLANEVVEKKFASLLRRNFSVSSSKTSSSSSSSYGYQKNNNGKNASNGNNFIERQSSTRVIQDVVKRAFSMRRSTSVNSDRYSRIYDQPKNVEDDCWERNYDDYGNDGKFDDNNDDGSMEKGKKKNNDDNKGDYNNNFKDGKKYVGCKVAKACKRLFSR